MLKKIKLIEVKSEIGAGTRGASLGPDAIKVAALDYGSNLFHKLNSVEIPVENHLLFEAQGSPYAKRMRGVLNIYEKLSKTVADSLKAREFPIILAGDHSTAGGTIAGIKMAFPDERIGVIWIDAHADIHSPYTTPSGNLHGMPLATALAEDNLEVQTNELDEKTEELWEKLKNIGGIAPKIEYSDLIYIGVRDTEAQEDFLMNKHGIRNVTTRELRQIGVDEVVEIVNDRLKKCSKIYISFDVDSLDPKISVGTGTPVPQGLRFKEARELLQSLCRDERVCCLEFVEINPTLDTENAMAETAFKLLEAATEAALEA